MARIRSIKPEFWSSEQVVECSPTARLLFIGMWNFCDDGGNHTASVKTLKMEVFPGDDFTQAFIGEMVDELLSQGLIIEYEALGKKYWHVTGWNHQKIEKPSYRHPAYLLDPEVKKSTTDLREGDHQSVHVDQSFVDHSTTDRRPFADPSTTEGNGEEGNGEEGNIGEESPVVPPSDNIHPIGQDQKKGSKRKGTKLPSDFAFPEDWIAEAITETRCPPKAVESDRFAFISYYTNGKGKNETHIDWRMTWVNWYRKPYSFCSKSTTGSASTQTKTRNYVN